MKNEVKLLCGSLELNKQGFDAFSSDCISFLNGFSAFITAQKESRNYPDLRSFAFWLRKANLDEFAKQWKEPGLKGKGLVFHIAPSNVPLMFAYSLSIGLLCGNGNIVRVSENFRPEEKLLAAYLESYLNSKPGAAFKNRIAVVTYPHDGEINARFSAIANARVVWGGDETVEIFKQIPLADQKGEMYFPDKISAAVFNAEKVAELPENELSNLVHRFYNDTFAMDQNACSSPRLVVWLGENKKEQSQRFWTALAAEAENNYEIDAYKSARKIECACILGLKNNVEKLTKYCGNLLYVLDYSALPAAENLQGCFGLFGQYFAKDISELNSVCGEKLQTLVYYGIEEKAIEGAIKDGAARERIQLLPAGGAMNISMRWDGKNFTDYLSKK